MAQKRMFAQAVVLSDDFLDMPASTRCLYFSLGMVADDDGFVNNPRSIMRQCGGTNDDMQILLSKKYVHLFQSGVIVILHWKANNYLRKDRYVPSKCAERSLVFETENSIYSLTDGRPIGLPTGIPTGLPTGIRSKEKDSEEKSRVEFEGEADRPPKRKRFTPPTLDEVKAYCTERRNSVDPERFVDFYTANGWTQGRGKPIKDWRACVRTWEKSERAEQDKEGTSAYEREL